MVLLHRTKVQVLDTGATGTLQCAIWGPLESRILDFGVGLTGAELGTRIKCVCSFLCTVCMSIYIYVHIYIYIYVCVCVLLRIYTRIFACMSVCVSVKTHQRGRITINKDWL